MPVNSLISSATKAAPSTKVTASQVSATRWLPSRTATVEKPKVMLLHRSSMVSAKARLRSNTSLPVGPPAWFGAMTT